METKKCSKCENYLPLDRFNAYKRSADNLSSYCRECNASYQKEWRARAIRVDAIKHGTVNGYQNYRCRCDDCSAAYAEQSKNRYEIRQDMISTIKLERGCADCGYNEYACALDFDHREEEIKLFNVSESIDKSLDGLLAEIAKCDVVCAICHRIRTAIRAGHNLNRGKDLVSR